MRRMGITEAGFKRLAQSLSIPEQEEAAEPIDDKDTGKKHGPPYTLYHTTSREGFESIKADGVLKPKDDEGFVSFSAEPVKGGDIEGDDVVFEVEMPEGVMKVEYTEEWFEKYPEHAAYIAGEGWEQQFEYSNATIDEFGFTIEEEEEAEFDDALLDAFLVKGTEEEWISIEPGKEIPIEMVDVEKVGKLEDEEEEKEANADGTFRKENPETLRSLEQKTQEPYQLMREDWLLPFEHEIRDPGEKK